MQSFSWWGSSPDSASAKVARLAIGVNRVYIGLNKWNFTKSLYLDEAAFARDRLRKDSTVLQFYRNKLVAEVFQIILLQTVQTFRRNRYQLLHGYPDQTFRQRNALVNDLASMGAVP